VLDRTEHTPLRWTHRSGEFDLTRPLLMGVLNTTPDSFSDGGRYLDPARAVARAVEMVEEGAGLIDVGGESTRPGARPVDPDEEMERVLPAIRAVRSRLDVPISIDTRHAVVARAAFAEGADVLNDVSALADPAMAALVAGSGAGLVLMHMRGTPATMQDDPRYGDVVAEVIAALRDRLGAALAAGIDANSIAVDPGIGFGKSHGHNLQLVSRLQEFASLGRPILLGLSRKAFLGAILGGAAPEDRDLASAAACVVGLLHGARIFRVHNVAAARDALLVAEAIRSTSPAPV
jgi:dihydropteroate synthase